MPKFKQGALPKYGKHKASGQAVVKLNGRDVYLGPYGSKESRVEYDRVIGEWLTAGRSVPKALEALGGVTVNELLVSYFQFAERHYQKDGKPTGELGNIADVVLFGRPAPPFSTAVNTWSVFVLRASIWSATSLRNLAIRRRSFSGTLNETSDMRCSPSAFARFERP